MEAKTETSKRNLPMSYENPLASELEEEWGIQKGFITLTTHERLTQLERAQRENNEQFTVLMTVVGSQGQDIKRIFERLGMMAERQEMNERFDTLTSQLDTFASQLSDHTAMLAQILTKLDELK